MSPLAFSLRFIQTQPDAQLAALARAGHERAFEALVRRYRRPLLAYCRRIGPADANVEDTLQQALLQAWVALRAGPEVREPRAWLYRIVHNVAVSNSRRVGQVAVELHAVSIAHSADYEAEQRIAVREALAGLASLPELQREVMVGTAVDGLSHQEIARELGLTSGAVRGLIYRARSALRSAAAVVIPGPLVQWAARQGSGRVGSSGIYEAIGGGGSAGLGGVLLKGGAIAATAGALAAAGGVSGERASRGHRALEASTRTVTRSVHTRRALHAGERAIVLVAASTLARSGSDQVVQARSVTPPAQSAHHREPVGNRLPAEHPGGSDKGGVRRAPASGGSGGSESAHGRTGSGSGSDASSRQSGSGDGTDTTTTDERSGNGGSGGGSGGGSSGGSDGGSQSSTLPTIPAPSTSTTPTVASPTTSSSATTGSDGKPPGSGD